MLEAKIGEPLADTMEDTDNFGFAQLREKMERDRRIAIKSYTSNGRRQKDWGIATHANIMTVRMPDSFPLRRCKNVPFWFVGNLVKEKDNFVINVREPGLEKKTFPVVKVEAPFARFADQYASRNTVFDFGVEQVVDGEFTVCEIRQLSLPGDSNLDCDGDDLQMQEILKRCRHIVRNNTLSDEPRAVFSDAKDLRRLYEICKDSYPAHVQVWAEREFRRLRQGLLGSDDRRHIMSALSDVLRLNWSRPEISVPSSEEIRRHFKERFFGMDYVLQEVLEIASCLRINGAFPKRGLLLSGAPGTGKTEVLAFLAELLDLPLVRIDVSRLLEADSVLGSSRIYSNGKTGELFNGIAAAGSVWALVVLEEADKDRGKRDAHMQPIDAFLNVLEGSSYREEFLELDIPTNGLFFTATANDSSKLSSPMLSRFREIKVPAYSYGEKSEILHHYMFPEAAADHAVSPEELSLTPEAERALLCEYAVEPGVRELKSYVEKIYRNYVYRRSEENLTDLTYTESGLRKILGPPKACSRNVMQMPGCVFAAVFNEQQAVLVPIQATASPGKGELHILNAGDQQKNQIKLAYAFVKNLLPEELSSRDVTVALMVKTADSEVNDIGCAAAIAILAAMRSVSFTEKEIFIGGCDLYGTLYTDHSTIDSVIACLPKTVSTIYAPTGANRLLYHVYADNKAGIVEMPNVLTLFQLISGKARI